MATATKSKKSCPLVKNMFYKIQIHKRKIYITPRPKKDIPGGLVIVLNKPKDEKTGLFIATDIEENKKEYSLTELPEGIFIIRAFIKDGGK